MVEFAQAARNCNQRKPRERLRKDCDQRAAGRVRLTDCRRARTIAMDGRLSRSTQQLHRPAESATHCRHFMAEMSKPRKLRRTRSSIPAQTYVFPRSSRVRYSSITDRSARRTAQATYPSGRTRSLRSGLRGVRNACSTMQTDGRTARHANRRLLAAQVTRTDRRSRTINARSRDYRRAPYEP
jgi:hypothetical protein